MRALRLWPAVALVAAVSGCNCGTHEGSRDPLVLPDQPDSFSVKVTSITDADGVPLPDAGGGPFAFPFTQVKFHVVAQALDKDGAPFGDLAHPVAIRVSPGDIDPNTRTLACDGGYVEGDILAQHVYGNVRVWVLDAPADEAYDSTGAPIAPNPLSDPDAGYSFAAGTSQTLPFATPTIVDIRRQIGCDPNQGFAAFQVNCGANANPSDDCTTNSGSFTDYYNCYQHFCLGSCDDTVSPLNGDFVEVDEDYTTADAGMIVTGITSSGFYVTDLSAQKLDDPNNPSHANWDALPGAFGSIFVYTYSSPTDLYVGDHIISLTGSVEQFSGDTQLDFPSWIKVDQLPTPEFVPAPNPISLTDCASDSTHSSSAQDLCSYYQSDMVLESQESQAVVVDHVKPSNIFVNCDANGNGTLPLMANSKPTFGGWGCYPDQSDLDECACEIACITGRAQGLPDGGTLDYSHYDDTTPGICSELFNLSTYGQWEVVLADEVNDAGVVTVPSDGTRINVQTADALPTFDPRDFAQPQFQGVTLRIAGELNQVEASRPRWIIYARDPTDVCCYPVAVDGGGSSGCPTGLNDCGAITGL